MNTPHRLLPLLAFFFSLALAGLSSGAAGLEDWTLDDVLAKVLEANGGQEAVAGVTNVRIRGEVRGSSDAYEFVLLKKRPDMMRIRLMYKGRSIEAGFNGTAGWRRFTQGDQQRVFEITGDDLFQLRMDADFDGPLVGPTAAGVERRLVGLERIERIDFFIIEVSKPNVVSLHYVDSRTFRETKVIQRRTLESGEVKETLTEYSDYKRHGSIWVAMRSVRLLPDGSSETVVVAGVDLNPAILDRAFQTPEG